MKIFLLVITTLTSSLFAQTDSLFILEDGQRPLKSRWTMEGIRTKNTFVKYISNDKDRGTAVLLSGNGLNTSFVLRSDNNTPLNISKKMVLQWSMKYNQPFITEVELKTSDGIKRLLYSSLEQVVNNNDKIIHIGLGAYYTDSTWHTVTRDMQSDLDLVLKNVVILSVESVKFKGSGLVTDIRLMDKVPENIFLFKSNRDIKNLIKKGNILASELDYDNVLKEVWSFNTGDSLESYISYTVARNNNEQKNSSFIQWKMRMKADYKIYMIIESSKGNHVLVYDDSNVDGFLSKGTKIIHFGLGYNSVSNNWHIVTRDLQKDINRVFPGAKFKRVAQLIVKGHGSLSDVVLLGVEPVLSDLAVGWDVFDNDPYGATVKTVNDDEKGSVVQTKGASLKNGYKYAGKENYFGESVGNPFIKWSMNFSEPFDIMLAIESDGLIRFIHYTAMPSNYVRKKDGELYIGIGENIVDRRWNTVVRDLSQDIKLLGANLKYDSCKYFVLRGSGKISDIGFYKTRPEEEKYIGPSIVASMVLGQYSLVYNLRNIWGDALIKGNGLNMPESIVVDDNNQIYVSDTANNRILCWNKPIKVNGANSDIILSKGLNRPKGLSVFKDKLFVADTGNNRVLFYSLPLEEDKEPVVLVEGVLNEPKAVHYDGKNFFVADTGNNRVFIWNSIPANKQLPDVILGQMNMDGILPNRSKHVSYNTMKAPSGVYSDHNSLYISDTGNNRVLVFKEIPTKNGWHADVVIGQDDFTESKSNKGKSVAQDTLSSPTAIYANGSKLFIADTGNNRVLLFNIDSDIKIATGLIGQKTFTEALAELPSRGTLLSPSAVFVKDDLIYISDSGNNRVLLY